VRGPAQVHLQLGECASGAAHYACRYAGAIAMVDGVQRPRCAAPAQEYAACPYSAAKSSLVPILNPREETSE
jgi:hypothetical protein